MLNDYGSPDGGAERQMLRLRTQLRERGHAVKLLASDAPLPGVPSDRQSPSAADLRCRGRNDAWQRFSSLHNASAAAAVRHAVRTFRPHVAHLRMFLWQLSPAVLGPLADVPTLYHVAQYKAVCPTGSKRLPDGRACAVPAGRVCRREGCVSALSWPPAMLQLAALRKQRSVIDRVVLLSAAMRPVLESGGFDGPFDVVHNGVPERPARPPLTGPPTAAFAGRLVPDKGVDVLLEAFAAARHRVPDARLLVVGDGPARPRLEAEAERLGVAAAVTFAGHLDRPAMEAALDAAWVQATPSQWAEPFGNVSTEAMMRGTAVLASDLGGQSEIVDDPATGRRLPPRETDAWAAALAALLGNRDHAERVGAAARVRAQTHFSEAATTDRIVRIYGELTAGRPGRSTA